jgi:hypothetical protein
MSHPTPQLPNEPLPRRRLLLALASGSALSACGGGASDAPSSSPAAAGPTAHPLGVATGGTGRKPVTFLSAMVTSTGPLGVGGVTLDTQTAVLTDGDGQRLHESKIAPGMNARVLGGPIRSAGGQAAAQAYEVRVDTQVVGPATWLDARNAIVLGQRVSLNAATVVVSGDKTEIQVWGQLDLAQGRIVATRIAPANGQPTPMLRGLLSAVDHASGTLRVGTLVARAPAAGVIPGELAAGAVVRLSLGDELPDGSRALLVARDDALRPPDGLHTELEGRVTAFSSLQQFQLDGVTVNAQAAQISGASQLQPGAKVSASGTMQAGVLVAKAVEAEAPEPLELEGRISALDPAARSFVLKGWIVQWSPSTVFITGSAAALKNGRSVNVIATGTAGGSSVQAIKIRWA